MGTCYSVRLDVLGLEDISAAESALKKKIRKDESENRCIYNLDIFSAQGVEPDHFDNLIRIFLAGFQYNYFEMEVAADKRVYCSDFDASYGWEGVMVEMFELLESYLGDGSRMLIECEAGIEELVIEHGQCVQIR